jgi:hypothetical protein
MVGGIVRAHEEGDDAPPQLIERRHVPLAFPDVHLMPHPDLGRALGQRPRLGHGHEAVVRAVHDDERRPAALDHVLVAVQSARPRQHRRDVRRLPAIGDVERRDGARGVAADGDARAVGAVALGVRGDPAHGAHGVVGRQRFAAEAVVDGEADEAALREVPAEIDRVDAALRPAREAAAVDGDERRMRLRPSLGLVDVERERLRVHDVARHVNGQHRRREEQRGDHFLFSFSISRQSFVLLRTHQML